MAFVDEDLRQHVIDELKFEPSVDAANIGVAASDGVVTLTGHVASFPEKFAAEQAARRVKGVRGIAEEIEVRYPEDKQVADDQIAARALDIIAWDTTIPDGVVQVKVQKGWISLMGTVEWYYQRVSAESAVRRLSGVVGIQNLLKIKTRVQAGDVKKHIEDALKRNAVIEAGAIHVEVKGPEITLLGKVHSWEERQAAEHAAWSVPGVSIVTDRIVLG